MNDINSNSAILISGGAGFIGSTVAMQLAQSGYLPVVLDDLSSGIKSFVKWGPFFHGSCADRSLVGEICQRYSISACIHFAGRIEVGQSVIDPLSFYQSNVLASIDFMSALQANGVNQCVFSSTAAVYAPQMAPLLETDLIRPSSPYGRTKRIIEEFLHDFGSATGFRSVILRYFNAAGGDPSGQIGESHNPETHLIPCLLDVAAQRRPHFSLFGTDYDTPDGTCIRDYIHVCDLADAHVLAVQHLLSGGSSSVYNVGTGTGYSVLDVIRTAREIVGQDISIIQSPRRPGDSAILVANTDAIRRDWNWTPRRSDLRTIITDAWTWRSPHHPFWKS
ncbi:UDP-glucose 4-epimerase GalE [bacterium]|nr:UDP-glucose 4-epimerase GalE [bacterium]